MPTASRWEGDLLVLDPDSDFFRYLNESEGSR